MKIKHNKLFISLLIIGIIFILIGVILAVYNVKNDEVENTIVISEENNVIIDELTFEIGTNSEDGLLNVIVTNTTTNDIYVSSIRLIITDNDGNENPIDVIYDTTITAGSSSNIFPGYSMDGVNKIEISVISG